MGGSAYAVFAVGALLCAGGLAGFVRARSKPSLFAGVGLGTLMLVSGYIIAFVGLVSPFFTKARGCGSGIRVWVGRQEKNKESNQRQIQT